MIGISETVYIATLKLTKHKLIDGWTSINIYQGGEELYWKVWKCLLSENGKYSGIKWLALYYVFKTSESHALSAFHYMSFIDPWGWVLTTSVLIEALVGIYVYGQWLVSSCKDTNLDSKSNWTFQIHILSYVPLLPDTYIMDKISLHIAIIAHFFVLQQAIFQFIRCHGNTVVTFVGSLLTLKAPPIICSRRQFQIMPLFQK